MKRVGLVTALLPPHVGGTEILLWRLFRDDPELAIVSGIDLSGRDAAGISDDGYRALEAPTLSLPYPRLRGYRYGLGPLLGALATGWLVKSVSRVVRFLRQHDVQQVVSVPHNGPFAVLGFAAARWLGLEHTFYILDAWEEAGTGPMERALVRSVLHRAARLSKSHLAVVSPALGAHYRSTFGFPAPAWIPNPAPLPDEWTGAAPAAEPFLLFTGGIKPFNVEALRSVAGAVRRCRVLQKLVITGGGDYFESVLRSAGELHERIEFRRMSRAEMGRLQRQAAVLLVATNVEDRSETTRGYLPGRLPEYVASGRPVLVLGRADSDAARAVRHWNLGRTTSTTDEGELAAILDELTTEGLAPSDRRDDCRKLFAEIFSRDEARRRLLDDGGREPSDAAARMARAFESL